MSKCIEYGIDSAQYGIEYTLIQVDIVYSYHWSLLIKYFQAD